MGDILLGLLGNVSNKIKLVFQVYSKLADFEGDVRLMVHNITVMNGGEMAGGPFRSRDGTVTIVNAAQ